MLLECECKFQHLRNVHKISPEEYDELFRNEDDVSKPPMLAQTSAAAAPASQPATPPIKQDYLAPDVNLPKPPKTDIQDKTNKKCSSCKITFDSR